MRYFGSILLCLVLALPSLGAPQAKSPKGTFTVAPSKGWKVSKDSMNLDWWLVLKGPDGSTLIFDYPNPDVGANFKLDAAGIKKVKKIETDAAKMLNTKISSWKQGKVAGYPALTAHSTQLGAAHSKTYVACPQGKALVVQFSAPEKSATKLSKQAAAIMNSFKLTKSR